MIDLMRIVLHNGRILIGEDFQENKAIFIENGRITDIFDVNDQKIKQAEQYIDLNGDWLVPGFIDIQVNGGGGVLFNNAPTVDTLRHMMQAHRPFGTTAILPTLISDSVPVMQQAIAAVRTAIAEGVPGILGIHLEGPYLAHTRKGTHDARQFRVPDTAEIQLATSLDNGLTLITLAPECVPTAIIKQMIARGALVAAGHSAAAYEDIRAGLNAGISGFTHLYNAMSPLQGRHPGVVGAALEDQQSWCSLIVDGIHVHPASLRVALAAKARGKLLLVTDAMPVVGSDHPHFNLYGETISVIDGVVRNAAGALAGSALDMATAVRNTVKWLKLPLAEAARMASTYPARALGLDHEYGYIANGYRADFVLLDQKTLQVKATWIKGHCLVQRCE